MQIDLEPNAEPGRRIQFKVKAIRNLPHGLETLLILTCSLLNRTLSVPQSQAGSWVCVTSLFASVQD